MGGFPEQNPGKMNEEIPGGIIEGMGGTLGGVLKNIPEGISAEIS